MTFTIEANSIDPSPILANSEKPYKGLSVVPSAVMKTASEKTSQESRMTNPLGVYDISVSNTGTTLSISTLKGHFDSQDGRHYIEINENVELDLYDLIDEFGTPEEHELYVRIDYTKGDPIANIYPETKVIFIVEPETVSVFGAYRLATLDIGASISNIVTEDTIPANNTPNAPSVSIVKATLPEIEEGIEDTKFITPKGLEDKGNDAKHVYLSSNGGDDNNEGTQASPMLTIAGAINKYTRNYRGITIYLVGGETYYIDSYITNYSDIYIIKSGFGPPATIVQSIYGGTDLGGIFSPFKTTISIKHCSVETATPLAGSPIEQGMFIKRKEAGNTTLFMYGCDIILGGSPLVRLSSGTQIINAKFYDCSFSFPSPNKYVIDGLNSIEGDSSVVFNNCTGLLHRKDMLDEVVVHTATLVNGFTGDIEYYKIRNIVYVNGYASSSSSGTMFTLPAGFRPSHNTYPPSSSATAGGFSYILVNPSGATHMSLSGSSYRRFSFSFYAGK